MSRSKTIVKNTLFLYIRMLLIMGITLFTSRIVLRELGTSDYGLYSIVGGIVAMLGVLNSAMTNATQRYLSFDVGKGDPMNLKRTFSATLTIHFFIAGVVLVICESLGLWYINEKLVYPDNRVFAVNVLYQFTVLTLIVSIIQVPYNALILAKERMNIYAYVSILEVILKLLIVYLLAIVSGDKLIVYGLLIFCVTLLIRVVYQVYCRRNFKESAYQFQWNRGYYRELLSYSGWNLFGNVAVLCRNQGNNIVLNYYFGTLVNAAYGITNQVHSAVSLFVTNFQTALNPQIIKTYAGGDLMRMHKLIIKGSKLSFFLAFLIVLPIYFNIDFILEIWLVAPPQFTDVFIKLSLVVVMIDCLSGPLMVGAQATGRIKFYQMIVGGLIFLNLPLSYCFMTYFFHVPEVVFYVSIGISLTALLARLLFLKKMISFSITEYVRKVSIVILIVVAGTLGIYYFFSPWIEGYEGFKRLVFSISGLLIITLPFVFFVGLDSEDKRFLRNVLMKKIK